MSTSEFFGIIKGLSSTASDAGDHPASTSQLRALANNINHIADQRGQVLAAWFSDGSTSLGVSSSMTGSTGPASEPAGSAQLLKFKYTPTLHTNGYCYGLRIRMGGYVKAGTGKFIIAVSTAWPISWYGETTTTTSATYDWLPMSRSYIPFDTAVSASNQFFIDSDHIPSPSYYIAGFNDALSGSYANNTVLQPTLTVQVFASGSLTPNDTVLTQLYIAEYCGV